MGVALADVVAKNRERYLARLEVESAPKLSALYPPCSDPQQMFLDTDADIAIIGGSAGGGKTIAELLEPSQDFDCPGFNAVIFRRTMKEIKEEGGIWDKSMELYPLIGGKPNMTERYWTFPSGASLQFAGLENEASKYGWKGLEVCDILFDELTEFLESQVWYLMSRNRSSCGRRRRIRGSTNPHPGWVKRLLAPWVDDAFPNPAVSGEIRWLKREHDQIVWVSKPTQQDICTDGPNGEGCLKEDCPKCFSDVKSITFIRATVYENRPLLKANPGYIASLKVQDDVEMRRLLLGDWNAKPPNLVIDGFDETRNVASWRYLDPKEYRFYIGGDFGGHNTAEICVAEHIHSGHLSIIAEDWPGMSREWSRIGIDTKALVPDGGYISDGAGGNRTGEQGWRQAFRTMGIPMAEPDPQFLDPKLQYAVMNDLFRRGQLDVFDTCKKTIDMLNRFMRKADPKTGDVTDEFDDSTFHLLAAGRYILVYLRPPEIFDTSPATYYSDQPQIQNGKQEPQPYNRWGN